ncbi:MAG: hypothetical protein ACERJ2_15725 [Filomicrobium sp.]
MQPKTLVRMGAAVGAAVGVAVGVAVFAQVVRAEPDLVIQAADSKVDFIGCGEGQPLADGRIVIRDEGDSAANLRGAGEFFCSFVAVYVPENIDLIDKDTKRSKIEPGEQRAVKFSLARDKVKRGRSYNGFNAGSAGGSLPTGPGALEYDDDLARDIPSSSSRIGPTR